MATVDDIVLEQLAKHLVGITSPAQNPVQYVTATWERHLPSDWHGPRRLLRELGGSVTRQDLTRLARAGTDPDSLLRLFVGVLAWGRGKKNARLFYGWKKAFAHPTLLETLAKTAEIVRDGRPADAYRAWCEADIRGIGLPFLSKWLFASSLATTLEAGVPRALILDSRVSASLRQLDWRPAKGVRRYSVEGYAEYLAALHRWAEALGVTAEHLELFLFRANGNLDAVPENVDFFGTMDHLVPYFRNPSAAGVASP